jgi:hypothetical protein
MEKIGAINTQSLISPGSAGRVRSVRPQMSTLLERHDRHPRQ